MIQIKDRLDFKRLLKPNNIYVIYVYSPWGNNAAKSKKRFDLFEPKNNAIKIIIDNSDAQSFINDWLQEQNISDTPNRYSNVWPKVTRWVHGNGELIVIKNDQLVCFVRSILEITDSELQEICNGV